MSKELIIDFCKTEKDAKNVLERRQEDYILSFKINDVEAIDLNLADGTPHQLVGTVPNLNENTTFFQIQVWTLKT